MFHNLNANFVLILTLKLRNSHLVCGVSLLLLPGRLNWEERIDRVRFQVLAAVNLKMAVFWAVVPWTVIDIH